MTSHIHPHANSWAIPDTFGSDPFHVFNRQADFLDGLWQANPAPGAAPSALQYSSLFNASKHSGIVSNDQIPESYITNVVNLSGEVTDMSIANFLEMSFVYDLVNPQKTDSFTFAAKQFFMDDNMAELVSENAPYRVLTYSESEQVSSIQMRGRAFEFSYLKLSEPKCREEFIMLSIGIGNAVVLGFTFDIMTTICNLPNEVLQTFMITRYQGETELDQQLSSIERYNEHRRKIWDCWRKYDHDGPNQLIDITNEIGRLKRGRFNCLIISQESAFDQIYKDENALNTIKPTSVAFKNQTDSTILQKTGHICTIKENKVYMVKPMLSTASGHTEYVDFMTARSSRGESFLMRNEYSDTSNKFTKNT